ncbi:MAG: hypothetical protein ACRC9M_10145, partial [Aeromonas sp.]
VMKGHPRMALPDLNGRKCSPANKRALITDASFLLYHPRFLIPAFLVLRFYHLSVDYHPSVKVKS